MANGEGFSSQYRPPGRANRRPPRSRPDRYVPSDQYRADQYRPQDPDRLPQGSFDHATRHRVGSSPYDRRPDPTTRDPGSRPRQVGDDRVSSRVPRHAVARPTERSANPAVATRDDRATTREHRRFTREIDEPLSRAEKTLRDLENTGIPALTRAKNTFINNRALYTSEGMKIRRIREDINRYAKAYNEMEVIKRNVKETYTRGESRISPEFPYYPDEVNGKEQDPEDPFRDSLKICKDCDDNITVFRDCIGGLHSVLKTLNEVEGKITTFDGTTQDNTRQRCQRIRNRRQNILATVNESENDFDRRYELAALIRFTEHEIAKVNIWRTQQYRDQLHPSEFPIYGGNEKTQLNSRTTARELLAAKGYT